jgi:hypothetical protein
MKHGYLNGVAEPLRRVETRMVPDLDNPDQEAKDHGNLMDLEVAEVERESAEVIEDDDHSLAGIEAEPNGPSKPLEPHGVSDEQAAEFLAERDAEAQDSVT